MASRKDGRHNTTHVQSRILQRVSRKKTRSWYSLKALQRPAEKTACTVTNQASVMAAGGFRPRQLALISQKGQWQIRGREAQSRKETTQKAERVSSLSLSASARANGCARYDPEPSNSHVLVCEESAVIIHHLSKL